MYLASDWYWFIGSDTANVWSSARAALVPVSDPIYVAWLEGAGNNTQTVETMAELETALRVTYPAGTPRTYAADARYRKASGGIVITSLGPAAFTSDPASRSAINSANDYATDNPAATVQWKMADGSFVLLDAAKIATLKDDMAAFIQSAFNCEGDLVAGIDDGSVTTIAQVDDAFAAISNVFP